MSEQPLPKITDALSDERFAEGMKAIQDNDPETAHMEADDLLCAMLVSLGFPKTVAEFRKVHKWYA